MSDEPTRKLSLTPFSQIEFERVEWLMDCWMPRRSLTLLVGREGLGKSTLACDIAAQATRGELNNGEPMNVIYLATEDSPEMTVGPRLEAAGAVLDRVHALEANLQFDDGDLATALDLPMDYGRLEQLIEDENIGLVILDAAKSAMNGKIDGNRDDEVRRFLEPMSAIANRRDCAFLALAHFGKRQSTDTGQLVLGSIAWSQVPRSVISVAKDEDTGQLVITNTKANLAPRTVSREASIESVPIEIKGVMDEIGRIIWTAGESTRDARDLLRDSTDEGDDRSEIEAVVLDYLESVGGSAPAGDVLKATRAAGLNDNAVKKSRKKIGVSTRKSGGTGKGWVWSIDAPKVPDSGKDSKGSHTHTRESLEPLAPSTDTKGVVVDFPAPDPTPFDTADLDPIESSILDALSPQRPQNKVQLKRALPASVIAGADLDGPISRLVTAGHITIADGGYLRTTTTA